MRCLVIALFASLSIFSASLHAVETISTIAGNGKFGSTGDTGPATSATLTEPKRIAIDAIGNVYIADRTAQRVRKIDPAGTITTFAGNGTNGTPADGMPATQQSLNGPVGVAVDSNGNVYITEKDGCRVDMVDSNGNIFVIAGDGTKAPGSDGIPATLTSFIAPTDVAVDSLGNIYIVDGHRIRVIDTTGTINAVGGQDLPGFGGDGGPAANALFDTPSIAVDLQDNLVIADTNNNRIRFINSKTLILTTIAGTGTAGYSGDGGPATSAELGTPGEGIAVDVMGNIYFGDYGASGTEPRIRKISPIGIITTIAGNGQPGNGGDGGPAFLAQIGNVNGIATTETGDIVFSDLVDAVDATLLDVKPFVKVRKVSANNPDVVQNPIDGLGVQIADRTAGDITLAISTEGLNRTTFNSLTDFDDIPSRKAIGVVGNRPNHKFIQSGIFVSTTTSTDAGTNQPVGKMRKTLAVGREETGESALVAAMPSNRDISKFGLKGKFLFGGSKPDAVTFSGNIELPMGLDLTQQDISVSVGNIVDTVTVNQKGAATAASAQNRISKVKVKWPKPAMGTQTGSNQSAAISFTLSLTDMSGNGFDTEGISPSARTKQPNAKAYSRGIQVALLVGGVTYELKAPVVFKLSSKADSGTIQGRSGR